MKVIQIGTGGWGKNHCRVLSEFGVLTAICDMDFDRAKEFGEKYNVNYYKTTEELFEKEDFDAAFICTPTSTHSKIALELIKKKKHVFVEKPMTYLSEDGEKLVEEAKRNKVVLTCGYIERFNPAVAYVKDYLKTKKFGDLIRLEFYREHRMPLHIKDVGIIYDTSVHDIDTANWLFNEMPQVVFARSGKIRHEREDFTNIMLGYKNDKVAIISSNWITPKKVRKFSAVCTEAIISSDFLTQEIKVEKDEDSEIIQNEKQEPLMREIQNFLDSIEDKSKQIVKANEAVNVTKIAEAALLSSQKGTPIYLDLK